MITKRIVTQKITIDYNNSYNRSSAVHYDLRTKPSVLSANLCQKSNILIKVTKINAILMSIRHHSSMLL